MTPKNIADEVPHLIGQYKNYSHIVCDIQRVISNNMSGFIDGSFSYRFHVNGKKADISNYLHIKSQTFADLCKVGKWSLIINHLVNLDGFECLDLTEILRDIEGLFPPDMYELELVLFAGNDQKTSFGVHVDPQHMRAIHLQIAGTKRFRFNFKEKLRFSHDISEFELVELENEYTIREGDLFYLPTVFPHIGIYDGFSASIAIAIWNGNLKTEASTQKYITFDDYVEAFHRN